MALPTLFWSITPAGNGNLYSGFPNGSPSAPTWATVPNFLNQTTSVSINLTSYVTPTSGVTYALSAGVTLPLGWTFDGVHTISYNGTSIDFTPSNVSVVATLTSTGNSAASNVFALQGTGAPNTDTLQPCVPLGMTSSAVSSTSATLSGIIACDPNQPGHTWSGMSKVELLRGGAHLAYFNTSAGNQPVLIAADIGPQISTITQSGADVSMNTTAQDAPYPTNDCYATDFQQLTASNWIASFRVDAFGAADGFSNFGLMARASMAQTAAFVAVVGFPFSSGNGVLSKFRPANGGNDTNLSQASIVISGSVYFFLERAGDTYSFFYSLDGNNLVSLGTQTQVMGSALYVGPVLTTNNAVAVSVTFAQVSIQTTGLWSVTDGTVIAGTTPSYQARSIDVAGNVSSVGPALTVSIPSTGGLVNWPSGLGLEDTSFITGYGTGWTNGGSAGSNQTMNNLSQFLSFPSYWTTYCWNVGWGVYESSTKGVYDFTQFEYVYNQLAPAGRYALPFIHGEAVPVGTYSRAFTSPVYLPTYLDDNGGVAGNANLYGGLQALYFGVNIGGYVPMIGRSAQTSWTGNPHPGASSVIEAFANCCIALCNHVMTTGPSAGTQVKNLPYFLGIAVYETAYNLSPSGQTLDPSWGGNVNLPNWYFNYANVLIPMLRQAVPNVCWVSRANYGNAPYMQAIAQAGLTYKWAFGGGTDFTQSPTDMDKTFNGSNGGVDYRVAPNQLPSCPFREDPDNTGGSYGDSFNGGSVWSNTTPAANMIAALKASGTWGASLPIISDTTQGGAGNVGWQNSHWAAWTAAYTGGGFAQASPPTGFRAGPFT